jgi:hypothetical protein
MPAVAKMWPREPAANHPRGASGAVRLIYAPDRDQLLGVPSPVRGEGSVRVHAVRTSKPDRKRKARLAALKIQFGMFHFRLAGQRLGDLAVPVHVHRPEADVAP